MEASARQSIFPSCTIIEMLRCFFLLAIATSLFAQTKRNLKLEDVHLQKTVSDPQVSPDGQWVAYTVSTIDREADKSDTDVWMTKWDGTARLRLTTSKESENRPRWSPDNQWLAFLSSRAGKDDGAQVWMLNRQGGEAVQLTKIDGGVTDYSWSPDSKRLALVVAPKDEDKKKEGEKEKTVKPLVIDRYRFKNDNGGYLTKKPNRIYLFDIAAKKSELLTNEEFEERSPVWSPDGSQIAFVAERSSKESNKDLWQLLVVESKAGGSVRQLTSGFGIRGANSNVAWSQDGKTLYYLQGREPKFSAYDRTKLAAIPAAGGSPRILTSNLDRSVSSVRVLPGEDLSVLVTDDMLTYPVRVPKAGGSVKKMLDAKALVSAVSMGESHMAALVSTDDKPSEIFALEDGKLRELTSHNSEWLAQINLGESRKISFNNKSGNEVHGLLTLPPDYKAGQKIPFLLRIHGGPNGQDSHSFQFERHLLAANGYAVLAVNYRGSSGRDEAFQTAIFADWGNKEVEDLLAGVDHVVALGIADPARLGIGGWSYGAILTNYTIARDGRFKAGISGAGSSLQISLFGSDQYIEQYELEVGAPWKAKDLWMKLSYPFFEVEKIKTPTLFLGGEKDFNVPIIGGEQMYQALKTTGVETQLIIYPGEHHGIAKPSYVEDRLKRYLDWYSKYLH